MSGLRQGQYSTEYIVIMGIGIGIIAIFLVYVTYLYGSFAVSSAANQITNVANTLAEETNYVSSQGPGSVQAFPISVPLIQPQHSFFCGNIIKLQTSTELGISRPGSNVSGMLPLSGGTYNSFARDEGESVLIGMQFPIALVQQSYSVSVSGSTASLSYSLSFYNFSGGLAAASFNMSVFSTDGAYITSGAGSTGSGQISGSLALPYSSPTQYVVEIYPSGSGDYSSTCISV